MSRNSKLHTLAANALAPCLAFAVPAFADDSSPSALALPSTAITSNSDNETVSLATPLPAGSRLNLSAMDTPASTSSLSSEVLERSEERRVGKACRSRWPPEH